MRPPERGAPAHPGQRVAGAGKSAWQQIDDHKDRTDWPRLQVCGWRPPGPGELAAQAARAQGLNDPRFRRVVERIHTLGPRPLGELLIEVKADRDTLERYAVLSIDTLTALGGDRWPTQIYAVAST